MAWSSIRPSIGKARPTGGATKEQLSLPGPTLPHELTSLSAAGIAKILLASDRPAVPKKSNWALSLVVAAAVIAGTLGATFYAMPGLANAPAAPKEVAREKPAPEPSQPAPPADPLARVVEVTGVRFVTDVPGRQPQISYLVVNHSNVPLLGVSVSVTLRGSGRDDLPPISQFSFRAPRLGPYESKEMVSSIERFNGSVALPDWRDVRAEVRISQ